MASPRRPMPPPPEVLDYFRRRDMAPRFSWLDIWAEEHAHAFTVAGVTETKVLAEFKAAIDKAIVDGWGFDRFRSEMQRRLTPLGWWGPRDVIDPEGRWRRKRVDFSKARRLEITFWSNMRAARAAGQWDRIQRTKEALPYLLYVMSTAAHKRREHLGWVGIILPIDHPFWRTHFPPNGWRCQCAVRQISADRRDDYLRRPHDPHDPNAIKYTDVAPEPDLMPYINHRTGQTALVPRGIDPGWHSNPGLGRGRQLGRILADEIDDTPLELARARVRRMVTSDGYRSMLWRAQSLGAERQALSDAGLTRAEIDRRAPWSNAPHPVARLPDAVAARLKVAPTVTVTDAAVGHNTTHPYPDWIWEQVQSMVDQGEIWRRPDGRVMALQEIDGRPMMLVLARIMGPHMGVITLFPVRGGFRGAYVRKYLEGAELISE